MSNTCICKEVNTVDYADMVIQDQLLRGIADQEILADLLGDEKSDRLTSDIVDFIARKEQAKSECGTVAGDSTAARVIAQKQGGRPCGGCGGPDHGGRAQRLNNCPAKYTTCERCQVKGHYTKKCIKCSDCQQWGHGSKKSDKPETLGTIVEDNSNVFVMSELAHITSRADIRHASVGNSIGRSGGRWHLGRTCSQRSPSRWSEPSRRWSETIAGKHQAQVSFNFWDFLKFV